MNCLNWYVNIFRKLFSQAKLLCKSVYVIISMELSTMHDNEIRMLGNSPHGIKSLVEHSYEVLVKTEVKLGECDSKVVEECKERMKALEELRDRKIMVYKDIVYSDSNFTFYLYTENIENGDLLRVIKRKRESNQELSCEEIFEIMKDLVNGLKYIHEKGVIHKNLKPSNIYIGNHNECIIGDFGFYLNEGEKDMQFGSTAPYIAPELWTSNPPSYSEASDVFALGCVLYEIYTFNVCFNEISNIAIRDLILDCNYIPNFSCRKNKIPIIEELIVKMLERSPQKRILLSEIEETMQSHINIRRSSLLPIPNRCNENIKTYDEQQPPPPLPQAIQTVNIQQPEEERKKTKSSPIINKFMEISKKYQTINMGYNGSTSYQTQCGYQYQPPPPPPPPPQEEQQQHHEEKNEKENQTTSKSKENNSKKMKKNSKLKKKSASCLSDSDDDSDEEDDKPISSLNQSNNFDILQFYVGEGDYQKNDIFHYLDMTVDQIQSCFGEEDIKILFPLLYDEISTITEDQRKEFKENKNRRHYYFYLLKVVLKKFGYIIRDDLSFETIPRYYEEWKGKIETKRILKMLKHSVKYIYKDDNYVELLEKLIKDQKSKEDEKPDVKEVKNTEVKTVKEPDVKEVNNTEVNGNKYGIQNIYNRVYDVYERVGVERISNNKFSIGVGAVVAVTAIAKALF